MKLGKTATKNYMVINVYCFMLSKVSKMVKKSLNMHTRFTSMLIDKSVCTLETIVELQTIIDVHHKT